MIESKLKKSEFNKKKRAIHDDIAGSYVVTRDSMPAKKKIKNPA